MAELRERVIAPCSVRDPTTGRILGADPGTLLLNILLFEENILDSGYLREFPDLVGVLGAAQVSELLEEGNVHIKCDARTMGENGRSPRFPDRARTMSLPLGTYCFNLGWDIPPNQFFEEALDDLERQLTPQVPRKLLDRLIGAINANFITLPSNFGESAVFQLEKDLSDGRTHLYRTALAHVLDTEFDSRRIESSKVWMTIEAVGDGAFRTSTNLGEYNISADDQDDIVRTALFAIGGLNLRLEEMRVLNGISGLQEQELPLFDSKVDFLGRQLAPDAQVDRFSTILTLTGLPDFGSALRARESVNIERLLKIRASPACHDFRTWLRTLDQINDESAREAIASFKTKVSEIVRSKAGRVVRFGAITGAGIVPGVGLPLAAGLGAVDSFVLDRLLGKPGPAMFLSKQYKSIIS